MPLGEVAQPVSSLLQPVAVFYHSAGKELFTVPKEGPVSRNYPYRVLLEPENNADPGLWFRLCPYLSEPSLLKGELGAQKPEGEVATGSRGLLEPSHAAFLIQGPQQQPCF